MRLLPFLWFSWIFDVVNSVLIMCFTMVQKIIKKKITEISQKYHIKAIKQYLGKNALLLQ